MSYITDNFHKWKPHIARYQDNNRIAIEYISFEEGYPERECIATINLPEEHLEDDEVIIKTYSKGEGLYEMMLQAGHIGHMIRVVESGFINAPVCKLLIK